MQNKEWKLKTPPDTEVAVGEDVLAMRVPLVRVVRGASGEWSFHGPGSTQGPTKATVLSAVVGAWPHVSALSDLEPGHVAVWSWSQHGWVGEFECKCGDCEQPVAADLDRKTWPSDLHPHHIVSVEQTALAGQVVLADIISTEGGIALLGPGDHRRTSDKMTPVAVANVIRRWPHTMHALRSLNEGRGMRWNHDGLAWHEYVIA